MSTLTKIKQLLKEEDLMGLIKMGAPEDEYDNEAKQIFNRINSTMSIDDIQNIIYDCFYNNFCIGASLQGDEIIICSKDKAHNIIGYIDNYKELASEISEAIGDSNE